MIRSLVALLVVAAVLAGAAPARAQTTLTLGGDQVVQALLADLAYFYRHSTPNPPSFALSGGNTATGIADTERGIADGGLVSRPLQAGDPADLVLTPLATSGICLISSRRNPVPGITRALLQDIVAGRVTDWSQIPGSKVTGPIVPVGRALNTGAGQVFQSVFVDPATPVAWKPLTVLTSAAVRDYVEQTPGAFGYVDLALTAPVHAIPYEGIACTRSTIANGTYPAHRPLGVVTRGKPRGAMARFLKWATTSRKARQAIATRYVPVG
ncbi:substrate-binding domain-containing protein [Solirubrobacter soli]|uniref:substrate-binding domain-containing protein n=1 Tax=Solirubrobacter soli TaxID=363832 RepID=UPI0003FCE927|nr:substrate-binding domain-containing protein [Solirubrobacter soli]